MAKTTTCPITQTIKNAFAALVNSTGALSGESGTSVSNLLSIYTASSEGAIVKSLIVTSTDSAAKTLNIYINNGTFDYLIGNLSIPANSGSASAGATSVMDILGSALIFGFPYDQSGKAVLPLQAGNILKVGVVTAVTATKTITVNALIEEF